MLSDRSRELLTAYVDGELTPRQRRHVGELLRDSDEARQLLRQLQEDASRLQGLPPPPLDQDLSAFVVNAIRERRLQPGRRRTHLPRPAEFPARALIAAAASVLLIVAMSTYLFVVEWAPRPLGRREPVADKAPNAAPVTDNPGRHEDTKDEPPPPALGPEPRRLAKTAPDPRPFVGPPAPDGDTARQPPPAEAPIHAAPVMELFQPGRVEVSLPVVLPLRDLAGETGRTKFLAELRKDSAYRIELPCRNATRAFDRIQAALGTHDVGLIVEQAALARLRQPLWKTNYLFFAEDVTPEDLAAVLLEANVLDHKGKPSEAQLGDLVLTRLSKDHRKQLSDLLGVDPVAVPPASGPLGTDPHRPLPELTASQVGDKLSGPAGKGASAGGGPGRPPTRQALALAYNPVRPRPGSPEVRRFLDARKPPRPGSLQILLILSGT
jgi:hypothetical protein